MLNNSVSEHARFGSRVSRFPLLAAIGEDGGLNAYAYVSADPVNGSDPSGLSDYRKDRKSPYCTGTRICANAGGLGIGNSGSVNGAAWVGGDGTSSNSSVANFICVAQCNNPAPYADSAGNIVVSGRPEYKVVHLNCSPDRGGSSLSRCGSLSGADVRVCNEPEPRRRIGYCGSGSNEHLVPDRVGGTSFAGPCAAHDSCYESSSSQEECDVALYADMKRACEHQSPTVACYGAVVVYYIVLRRVGHHAYESAQRARRHR
jgi:hypothetical protein